MSRSKFFCFIRTITLLILLLHLPATALAKNDRVVWDPGRIEQTLGLSETAARNITLVSSTPLKNVDLWFVPKLNPYLRVEPDHFDAIDKDTPVNVTVRFSIPFGTKPGPYDGTVHLRTGASIHPDTLKIHLNVAGLILSPPSEETVDRAQIIPEQIPGARLHFSQIRGQLMMVEAGLVDFEDGDTGLPTPLAETHGTDRAGHVSAMLEYFDRFREAYGLTSPVQELLFPERDFAEDLGDIGIDKQWPSVLTETLVQTYSGIRIHGRYAHGFFDEDGNLYVVLTRLLPAGPVADPQPSFSPEEAISLTLAKRGELIALDPDLAWLADLDPKQGPEYAVELVYLPMGPGADDELRLAYRINLGFNIHSALVYLDATDGAVLRALSTTPTAWYIEGTTFPVLAPDEIGGSRPILTTEDPATKRWYMGFGSSYVDGDGRRFFRPEELLSVSDIDQSLEVDSNTLSIDTSDSNSWMTDPEYIGGRRAATGMMRNMIRVLSWWYDRGWQSWDGRGSTLWTSINGLSPLTVNAQGDRGAILAGSGTTGAGLTTASSLEVMGHEFMHSVIDATSDLEYEGQSGAINESLADLFGAALTAEGDRYNDEMFGEDIGWSLRNLVDPTRSNPIQPDTYSNFVLTPEHEDHGGVHTNSGILNKAHSLVVQGGDFFGYSVESKGVARTTDFLRNANRLPVYPSETSMEEFAAAVFGYCRMVDLLSGSVGWPRIDDLCRAFENAYRATELLPGRTIEPEMYPDIKLEWAKIIFRGHPSTSDLSVEIQVKNISSRPEFNLEYYSILLTNESGETIPANDVIVTGTGPAPLTANETAILKGRFPKAFVGDYVTNIQTLTVRIEPPPPQRDGNPLNNWTRVLVGADYRTFGGTTVSPLMFAPWISNLNAEYFLHPTKVVYLERNTANGPFLPNKDEMIDVPISEEYFQVPPLYPYVYDELLEIKHTTAIPGHRDFRQAWFNPDGGLPELEGKTQYYVLVDCTDAAPELDETNNFFCMNCVPGDADWVEPGVRIRFPKGGRAAELFPVAYQEAAAKLPVAYPRDIPYTSIRLPRLNPRITPDISLP